jgi:3-oxoacyl-[acyl-carrier-protein] synthase III
MPWIMIGKITGAHAGRTQARRHRRAASGDQRTSRATGLQVWSKLIRLFGRRGQWRRRPILLVFAIYLITMVITVVPLSLLIQWLLSPLLKPRLERLKTELEQPSGSQEFNWKNMHSSGKVYITKAPRLFCPMRRSATTTLKTCWAWLPAARRAPGASCCATTASASVTTRLIRTGKTTHNNTQLTAAAVRALEVDGAIDCLVTGTSMPDQLMPNHGVMVHGELGIAACEVVATAGICLAGMTALKYAYMAILCGQASNAVATGSELASPLLHARNFTAESEHRVSEMEGNPEIAFEKDFLRWMLSDGAGAFLLRNQPADRCGLSLRIDWIDILSQAGSMEVCMYAGGEKQADGSLKGWQAFAADEWAARSVFAIKQDVRLLNENVAYQTIGKSLKKAMQTRADGRRRSTGFCRTCPPSTSASRSPDCMAAGGFIRFRRKNGLPICRPRATPARHRSTS